MSFDPDSVKKFIQDHLQEGLLLVVGTGLSIAEGIPGMWPLAEHLKMEIPNTLASAPDPAWADVVAALDAGDHLEAAMLKTNLKQSTVEAIVAATATLISSAENKVFERVVNDGKELPFTVFAKHLFKAGRQFHLITPNYDRLIEFATEIAGIGVDTRFFGYLHGQHEPKRSADCHRESYYQGKISSFRAIPCLNIHKPHGSLDWFEVNGKLVRLPVCTGKVPVIITPGASKYRESFRWAFDDQRTAGNKAATASSRLMFIGYGFNDDHLEQYVCPGLRLDKPAIILAKELTENATKVIKNSNNVDVMAFSSVSGTDLRTKVVTSCGNELILDDQLWHLDGFNKGVI